MKRSILSLAVLCTVFLLVAASPAMGQNGCVYPTGGVADADCVVGTCSTTTNCSGPDCQLVGGVINIWIETSPGTTCSCMPVP